MTSRTLIDHGTFYEGPRWHDGRWWVSDFYRKLVLSFDADGGDVREELTVEQRPVRVGWTLDGDLLVVSQMDHSLLRRSADGTVTTVASFGEHCGGFANDMVVDAHGRAYIGNAGFDLMARGEPPPPTLSGSTRMASWTLPVELSDFVFYTGCNVLKTSHIAFVFVNGEQLWPVFFSLYWVQCCSLLAKKRLRKFANPLPSVQARWGVGSSPISLSVN